MAAGSRLPDAKRYLTQIDGVTPTVAGPDGQGRSPRGMGRGDERDRQQPHHLRLRPRALLADHAGRQRRKNVRSVSGQLNQSLFGDLSQIQLAQAPPCLADALDQQHRSLA